MGSQVFAPRIGRNIRCGHLHCVASIVVSPGIFGASAAGLAGFSDHLWPVVGTRLPILAKVYRKRPSCCLTRNCLQHDYVLQRGHLSRCHEPGGALAQRMDEFHRPPGTDCFSVVRDRTERDFPGNTFRRVRRWIRKNLFAGNFDYRQLWMDASEKIRALDSSQATAAALAQLIYDGLGAIDITVWLRSRDAQTLYLALGRGPASEILKNEVLPLTDVVPALTGPVAVSELEWDASRMALLRRVKASLVVPLISSGRLVGLLTVSADRSGRAFDSEAREFLRVLAVHAASEFHKSELLETLVQIREAEAFRTFSTFLLQHLEEFLLPPCRS